MIEPRRRAVDRHLEANRLTGRFGSEHQMQIAGAKVVDDAAIRLVQYGALGADRPGSEKAPFIESWSIGGICGDHIRAEAFRRDEVCCALIAQVALAGADVFEIGARLDALGIGRHGCGRCQIVAGFSQQVLDRLLGLAVIAFAEVVVADLPLCIDQVLCRPIAVLERTPDLVVIVDCNRITDLELLDRLFDVVDLLLEGEFRGVYTDDDQALILVFFGPGANIGEGPDAVDAGIGPEIDEDDLAVKLFPRQRRRVQPLDGAVQRRRRALDGQIAAERLSCFDDSGCCVIAGNYRWRLAY